MLQGRGGAVSARLWAFARDTLPPERVAVAIGQGVAAVALVGAGAGGLPTSKGFTLAFALCGCLLALAAGLATLIPRQRQL